jgi:hypothetical protein
MKARSDLEESEGCGHSDVTVVVVCGDGSRKLGGDVCVREHCGALLPAGALVCVLHVH